MANYIITKTDGAQLVTIQPGTVYNVELQTNNVGGSGLLLIGQNVQNYGQIMANNFVRLLENQANSIAPANPLEGQLWWDKSSSTLKVWDNTTFKSLSTTVISDVTPTSHINLGDFWWDTVSLQLNVYSGGLWKLVGPIYRAPTGNSGIIDTNVSGTVIGHTVVSNNSVTTLSINGNVSAIINTGDPFILTSNISNISVVGTGVTFSPAANVNSTNINTANITGVIQNDLVAQNSIYAILAGTAVNSKFLNNIPADNYVTTTAQNTTLNGGLTVHDGIAAGDITIKNLDSTNVAMTSISSNIVISSGTAEMIINGTNDTITINQVPTLPTSVVNKGYLDFALSTFLTSTVDPYISANIASVTANVSTIFTAINHDKNFYGNLNANLMLKAPLMSPALTGIPTAPTASITDYSNQLATTQFVQNVVAAPIVTNLLPKPGVGNVDIGSDQFRFNTVYCNQVNALNADLAENYIADQQYEPGTVLDFGGDYEVTVGDGSEPWRVAGVVSTNPAYLMNTECSGEHVVAIALQGRCPVKVLGPIRKGDLLVSAGKGYAMMSYRPSAGSIIGKALESFNESGYGFIEVAITRC